MITLRHRNERGHADHGWLDARHTFSFAGYHDPAHMGFQSLRVMNEDRVAAGKGFGRHGHRDMEIITYVLEGALEHADSMGNGSVLRAGQFQKMSAGSGIEHSEFNASKTEPVHLYQIWLFPAEQGITPNYAEASAPEGAAEGQWWLVSGPVGTDAPLPLHQDARLYLGRPLEEAPLTHAFAPGRHGWLQVTRGSVTVNGHALEAGDGLAVSDEGSLTITTEHGGEVLLFDLA